MNFENPFHAERERQDAVNAYWARVEQREEAARLSSKLGIDVNPNWCEPCLGGGLKPLPAFNKPKEEQK